ncbi:molecular chaperone HtpG [Aggregatilinea lenta]|uniref:molecular chaperone HtpG n=1 Tax=Aggregatilinea lenta TaxID=913108 RepID=UPI0013C36243|nr:molecular chaperone HtpG [Aggregatilinea lenta]
MAENQPFQAEIKQLLNILVHSLYKDREIFLREIVSNASDALNRVRFEMLTNEDVFDKEAELAIHITVDEANHTILISDSGIGMTADEIVDGLGVIARSGARAFLDQVGEGEATPTATEIIGQFGVGFYSVFMVAERVEVTSRSYRPDAEAVRWISSGDDGYTIEPAEKEHRGTDILIRLREDAAEFGTEWRLRDIIKRHSDYVNFPIYLGKVAAPAEEEPGEEQAEEVEERAPEPVNQQTALWRRSPDEIEQEAYNSFYSSLTLDFEPPRRVIHTRADAPLQFYALLYIPHSAERSMLTPRKEPGLKLYARKVLIDEYNTDLLPEYLWFVQGVVDSEDLPLNVSRETIQDNPLVGKLKNVLTRNVINEIKALAEQSPDDYTAFWHEFRAFLKHGAISDFANRDRLLPLLRFASSRDEKLITLDEYVESMAAEQKAIYYVVADNDAAAARSVHLDAFRARGIDVLYLTDTIDGLLVPSLMNYKGHDFVAVDTDDLNLDGVGSTPEDEPDEETVEADELDDLVSYITGRLGERVKSVRAGKLLSRGPVRLVTPAGTMDRHQERLYRMLDREVTDTARILEINPHHALIANLAERLHADRSDPVLERGVDMLYELALLADGIHPNPGVLASDLLDMLQLATRPTSAD